MITKDPALMELEDRFLSDLERIASNLIKYCDVAHAKTVGHLSEAILRWMDFRLRFVEPKPRQVLYSNKFPKALPAEVDRALRAFDRANVLGEDINPFQGKGLTLFHDVSAGNRAKRTDHLWADWGIHHFHMAPLPSDPSKYYSTRSGPLLFTKVFDNAIAFIDVGDHEALEDQTLLETFVRNWPEAAESFRLKGVLFSSARHSAAEIKQMRVAGLATYTAIDGKAYLPNFGITTASTSSQVSLARNNVVRGARDLARCVLNPTQPLIPEISASGVNPKELSLDLTPRGIGIFGTDKNQCWLVPDAKGPWAQSSIGKMSVLMLPEWLLQKIQSASVNEALQSAD